MTAIEKLIKHIVELKYNDLPEHTVEATKTFVLDSIGVGLSGSRVSQVEQIKQAVAHWGAANQAQVWTTGEWLPAVSAAAINGYQIHNQEWDCVHEPAVVHPMAVILSALSAYGQAHHITGKQLILGVVVAVDVATLIGQSVTSALKFFRPSVCGCLGATAGICAMSSLGSSHVENAMGIAYSQISGTMQAHTEGSPMLAMQIGMNAQAALRAVDLATAGFQGPKDILEGPYGYFNLFEDEYDLTDFNLKLGRQFQIEQVSHKPFPTGRAGHGTIDGLLTLKRQHHFDATEVKLIEVSATPLIKRLVGRPAKPNMSVSYAKLCNGYIAATALLTGQVTVQDFDSDCLNDPIRLDLAAKLTTQLNGCKDPNALAPVKVRVVLNDGRDLQIDLAEILGHPTKPLDKMAQINKFTAACRSAVTPFSDEQIKRLINRIDTLEDIEDIGDLIAMMIRN